MQDLLEQLQQLALLAEAATPGEWHNSGAYPYNEGQVLSYLPERRNTSIVANCRTTNYYAKEATANAAFIAAARNLLTPENLLALTAALAVPVAAAPVLFQPAANTTGPDGVATVSGMVVCCINNLINQGLRINTAMHTDSVPLRGAGFKLIKRVLELEVDLDNWIAKHEKVAVEGIAQ